MYKENDTNLINCIYTIFIPHIINPFSLETKLEFIVMTVCKFFYFGQSFDWTISSTFDFTKDNAQKVESPQEFIGLRRLTHWGAFM